MSQSPSGSENQFQPHDTDTQNIPHSGVNGHERPVFNFDGKSLQDALDSGALHIEYDHEGNPKVIVPDNIGDHVDPTQSERTEVHEPLVTPQKKRIGKRGIAAIVSGVVGVAVIGGLGAGRVMGGDDPSPEDDRTTTSAGKLENENEAPNAGEKPETPQTSEFGLDAEKYVENPKQVMIDFVDEYNTWQNTGVTEEAMKSDQRYELPGDKYALVLNAASDTAFLENMLVSDWANNPNLVEWVDISVQNHQTTTWGALMTTYTGGTEATEAYRRYIDLDVNSIAVPRSTEEQVTVSANWNGRDNSDKNDIENIRTGGIDPNTETGDFTLTFEKSADGSMRLADYIG